MLTASSYQRISRGAGQKSFSSRSSLNSDSFARASSHFPRWYLNGDIKNNFGGGNTNQSFEPFSAKGAITHGGQPRPDSHTPRSLPTPPTFQRVEVVGGGRGCGARCPRANKVSDLRNPRVWCRSASVRDNPALRQNEVPRRPQSPPAWHLSARSISGLAPGGQMLRLLPVQE